MPLRSCFFSLALIFTGSQLQAQASEFDTYLQEKKLINDQYIIQDSKGLDEILSVLSAEDSRTLPLQVDNNTIIEKLDLTSKATNLTGIITTPDFAQFEKDLGKNGVLKLIHQNLLPNCDIFFEHEYQKKNPYVIKLNLNSESSTYDLKITQEDCKIN